jgi:hypothetical protein
MFAHSSGFKHGDKVHYVGTSAHNVARKWGLNMVVQFGVPTGGKRETWRLVSVKTGSELRLKEAGWKAALKPGHVDARGALLSPADATVAVSTSTKSRIEVVMREIGSQRATISVAERCIATLAEELRKLRQEEAEQDRILNAAVDASAKHVASMKVDDSIAIAGIF